VSDYRHNRFGPGQANLGQGNRNIGRDHVDNRRHVHNQGMYAEGNVHYRQGDYYHVEQGDSFDVMASGRGVGRLIAAVGMLISLAGFGGFAYVIFSGFQAQDASFNPMAIEVAGLPLLAVGFGTFLVGGIIAGIGGSMAKAARQRHEREMYYRRQRF
jgi:hypothetical protein